MKRSTRTLLRKKTGYSEGERVLLETDYLDMLDQIVTAERFHYEPVIVKCRQIMGMDDKKDTVLKEYDEQLKEVVTYLSVITDELSKKVKKE